MQCTCIPSSFRTQQSKLGMEVRCVGGQRGGHHHSIVEGSVLVVSLPCLVSALFTGPALNWNELSFFWNIFSLVSVLWGGFLNQLPKRRQKRLTLAMKLFLLLTSKNDFTLQTNAFIASDEIVSDTHIQIRITLLTNTFIASDKRVLCRGRALLYLEANVFRAADERYKCRPGDKRIENALIWASSASTHS